MASSPPRSPARPLDEREIDELQALLDRVPAPLEPLDVTMLDGYLCGVLLQPRRVPEAQWLAHVTDTERGRPLPPKFDPTRLHELVHRRYVELNAAIIARQWFDPWVFELDAEDADDEPAEDDGFGEAPPEVDAVYPWVAGFAAAVDLFPGLMQLDARQLTEPLALVFQHLDADDLEDADDLLTEIETMEPPSDLTEAVETLVRATLLLADISRPLQTAPARLAGPRPPNRRPPRR
ncbi:YecA family protein [Rhizobacter sp. Root1221]|uniref:YecA/YgfB family protein n=1 Tax=Rhizobacter sp. Root1221 TaxID=1736433 RepID=UPI0006F3BC38|nr:YecA family protein [Rhizobacter sp. Root1221]KQV99614.1 hypothetical protein ASC87_02620 [Rhizobacter sp. Root1221]